MGDTRGLLIAASAGLVGAVVAVLIALAIVPTHAMEVYAVGELSVDDFTPPSGTHAVVLVGDIMTWDAAQEPLQRHGAEYPFRAVAPLLRAADLTVGNLEGPVAVEARKAESSYSYRVPPWTLDGLSWSGFDLLSLANNHLVDCGFAGLLETFEHLRAADLDFFGAGTNLSEARQPKLVQVGDSVVAFCGLVAPENPAPDGGSLASDRSLDDVLQLAQAFQATDDRPGTMIATPDSIVDMVKEARGRADVVVVYLHWGVRYHRPATPLQKMLARAAIDAGADIVVGHHAHIWQPVEVYRSKPIAYGLGNFVFGAVKGQAKAGLVARVLMRGGDIDVLELFPLYTHAGDEQLGCQPKIMRGGSADRLLRELAALSAAPLAIEDGRAVLRLADLR